MSAYDRLEAAFARHAQAVERLLAPPDIVVPGGAHLAAMWRAHVATGGKRLRALLPAALVEAEGGDVPLAQRLGAAIELAHNATLVHDDIQDRDTLRRGQPTLWTLHGEGQAINTGDAMLVRPAALLCEAPGAAAERVVALVRLVAEATATTIAGQVADLALNGDEAPTAAALEAVAIAKTAPLFTACVEGALVCAGVHEGARREAARRLGAHLGLAFQLRDDLLDVRGVKGRDAAGADIREGKPTFPLLAGIRRAPPEAQRAVFLALRGVAQGDALGDATFAALLARAQAGDAETAGRFGSELEAAWREANATFGAAAAGLIAGLCDRLAKIDG